MWHVCFATNNWHYSWQINYGSWRKRPVQALLAATSTMKILLYGINFAPELTGIGEYTGELAAFEVGGHGLPRVARNDE